ncbi:putative ribosome-binding factor A, mitochondrial [Physella acuta]|uniref:putative ribosome-binding factor A, mitochondrial n=1 Tax=Physella acuta TaxID=109671 RepID=UPI0027DE7471|nr:putative ribosome-binding factor A, mitochondrial [Physella acuta]
MALLAKGQILFLFCIPRARIINTIFRKLNDYSSHEKSRHMQKLIYKHNAKKKKKWYQPHIAEPTELFAAGYKPDKKGTTEAQRTRARQLGHVLYEKITALINTGELSEELLGKQVLITSVKMLDNFSQVQVHWDCQRSDASEIEELLQSLAGKLRSQLISYHVLGRIPPIQFVKDKKVNDLSLLDQMFEIADYGPDYIPSEVKVKHTIEWTDKKDDGSDRTLPRFSNDSPDDNLKQNLVPEDPESNSNALSSTSVSDQSSDATQCVDTSAQDYFKAHGLNFRTDLYGLQRETLLKKVLAQRIKVKYQPPDPSVAKLDIVDFKLFSKDQEKINNKKGSGKGKQRMLERDVEDFQNKDENNDSFTYEHEETYDDYDQPRNDK